MIQPITYFLDRNLGARVVSDELRNAGAIIELHDDHFPQDTRDDVWLPEVGRRGWVVITKDKKIRYRRNERLAVKNAGCRVFVFTGKGGGQEIAMRLVNALPKLNRFVANHSSPFIATVTKSGSLSLLDI